MEKNKNSIDVLQPTLCIPSSSNGVNIDNLEIIIAPEDSTFNSRQTDIDLSVMNDIAISSNLHKLNNSYFHYFIFTGFIYHYRY